MKYILNNNRIIDKYNSIDLYTSICKYYNYFKENNIKNICITKLNFINKFTILLLSLLFNINIYLYNAIEVENYYILEDYLLDIINKNKDKIEIKPNKIFVKSKIFYKIDKNIFSINWNNIQLFYNSIHYKFNKWLKDYDTISIKNFNSIYFIYFIPICIFHSIQFVLFENSSHETFIIGDNIEQNYNLYICNKYSSTKYPKKPILLFYSFTLGQFLLYDVFFKNEILIGKLLSIYKFIDKNKISYKNKIIKLPYSYNFKGKNILEIKRNTKKLIRYKNTKLEPFLLTNLEIFYIKYNFNKMIFINLDNDIDKKTGYLLFIYLLQKYPNLEALNYKIQLSNNYLYNDFKENSNNLFSLYIKNSKTIVIYVSYILNFMEETIINNIKAVLNIIKIQNNIIIKPEVKKYQTNTLNIIVEIKMFYLFLFHIIPILFLNIHNIQINKHKKKRKQNIYKINIGNLNELSIKLECKINDLFKILLLNTLGKFFKNKIVLFNDKIIPLVDNTESILKTCETSYYMQYYLQQFIFYYLEIDKIGSIYPFNFIQITESNVLDVEKYNLNSDINCFPIQIHYFIVDDYINITISSSPEQDIIKYLIPELCSKL